MDRAKLPRLNTFAGLSLILDRAAERRDQSAWIAEQAASPQARYLLLDATGEAFMQRDRDLLRWLSSAERDALLAQSSASLLGLAEEIPYFVLSLDDAAAGAALNETLNARRLPLRAAGLRLPAFEAGLFAYAKGLSHWQRETRHCARCGSPVVLVAAGHRAQCTNPQCAHLKKSLISCCRWTMPPQAPR